MVGRARYKVPFIPEAKTGRFSIEKLTVSKQDEVFGRMRAMLHDGRFVPEGIYTALREHRALWMSDTPDEIRDHLWLERCSGAVLVHGLGLGVAVNILIQNERVETVNVVEINPEVVELVWPWFEGRPGSDKVTILVADALIYDPGSSTWDFAWHDIWPDIRSDNWETMKRLHRRFGRRVGEQNSWMREEVRRRRPRHGASGAGIRGESIGTIDERV